MFCPPDDRSGLFKEIGGFSQRKLKKVETKVVTGTGEKLVEKRSPKGLLTSDGSKSSSSQAGPARKLDLQVGLVLPGILIGESTINDLRSGLMDIMKVENVRRRTLSTHSEECDHCVIQSKNRH